MIQEQAREVLRTLRAEIAQGNYENARSKGQLATVFSDIRRAYMTQTWPNTEARDAVAQLEYQFYADRISSESHYGASTIHELLAGVERHISILPTAVKPSEIIIPTKAEKDADMILAELKRRGLTLAATA